ncbi:phosphoglycerate mutase-like protein [Hypomontagnella monticulosa]|nr:phosphoglycerate mutase-like protein [Hypomontagnella monticulosa]
MSPNAMIEKQGYQTKEDSGLKASRRRDEDQRWYLALVLSLILTGITLLRLWWLESTVNPDLTPSTPRDHGEVDIHKHLGHLSPFFVPHNTPKSLESGTPPGCTVSKAFLIHRHGSRQPHPDELDIIQDLAYYINNNSALFSNPRTKLPKAWSFITKGWNSTLGTDALTAPGRQQLFDYGVALRLRYPDLYSETDVVAGDEDRVVESARWFMDGYYGRDSNSTGTLRIIGEDNDTVSWITPHQSCPKWDSDFGENSTTKWQGTYLPPIAKRINKLLAKAYPGIQFTPAHIHGMLYACAYETATYGIDSTPWCEVFKTHEIMDNEYEYDLRMRGFCGYGLPGEMGTVLGSLLVSNVTSFLGRDDGPKLSLAFGHDKTIALGLTTLGLAADKSYPPTGPVDPGRAWRSAELMPFAGYMLWKRLECGEEKRVQLVLNGANYGLRPTGCRSDKYGSCAFEDFVNTATVQAAVKLTHGDTRWKAACQ